MKPETHRKALAEIIRPPKRLNISQWANENAWIPPEGNAEPGKYRLRRMPHQQAMLDDPLDPNVREIFWLMASQYAGKTLCLILIFEYVIQVLRQSILFSRSTKDQVTDWMRSKFLPTVEETPSMKDLLIEPRKRGSNSTALSRRFPGGTLKCIGAKSVGTFRGTSFPWIAQDEIDSYETTKEGDPCALIDRAAKTFHDAHKIKCSTTTIAEASRVHAGYLKGDQQLYFLPCPACGGFQDLDFFRHLKFTFTKEEHARFNQQTNSQSHQAAQEEDVGLAKEQARIVGGISVDTLSFEETINGHTWEIGQFAIRDTKRAIVICEHCRRGWTDQQRLASYWSGHPDNPSIVVNGKELRAEWRATAPFNGIRSRSLCGMYGSIGLEKGFDNYLHQWAEQFLTAKKEGRETLMAWWNMFHNQPFEDEAEKVDERGLADRAEDYDPKRELPREVCWLNFGSDVQENRVEILSFGWGDKQECWVLDHEVIFGDLDKPEMRERVANYVLNKKFNHPVFGEMKFRGGMIDSGDKTTAVYRLCGVRGGLRLDNIWSVKGFDEREGVVQLVKERRFGGMRANLDVSQMKQMVYTRLKQDTPGPTFIHFHKQLPPTFYAGLCSEKSVLKKMPNGGYKRMWVKKTSATRNEVLDMTNYAFGNFILVKPDFEIEQATKRLEAEAPKPPAPVEKISKPEPKPEPKPAPRPTIRRRIRINNPFAGVFGRR